MTMNIPSNLNECFIELDNLLSEEDKEIIKSSINNSIMIDVHIGRNIRNEWGLWQGSKLKDYFESLGVWHADDMSGIILNSYWCFLKNQPINLNSQIEYYQNYWEDNYPNDIPKEFLTNKGKLKNLLK